LVRDSPQGYQSGLAGSCGPTQVQKRLQKGMEAPQIHVLLDEFPDVLRDTAPGHETPENALALACSIVIPSP
jgi:hypothetical protein